MAPITWRNVDAPNIGDPTRTLALSQGSFNTAFEQLAKPLQQIEQTNQANWQNQKVNNTNEVLNFLSGFKSVEDAQAAINSGALDRMMGGMGAQVDQAAVRQAQKAVIPDLQQRFTQGVAYDNAKASEAEKPIVGALTALLPDPKNRKHLAQAAQQYQEAGMLRSNVVADLLDKARTYDRSDAAERRAEEQLNIHRSQVNEQRAQRKVQEKALRMGEIQQGIALEAKPLVSELANIDALLKTSIFSGTSPTDVKGRQAIADTARKTGIFAGDWSTEAADIWDGVRKLDSTLPPERKLFGAGGDTLLVNSIDPKTGKVLMNNGAPVRMEIPLTAELVSEALLRAKGSNWTDPSMNNVREQLAAMANDPGMQAEYLKIQQMKARRDQLLGQINQLDKKAGQLANGRLESVPK